MRKFFIYCGYFLIIGLVLLVALGLYGLWSELVGLSKEELALFLMGLGLFYIPSILIAYRLGRSNAFSFISGFQTGQASTIGVLQHTNRNPRRPEDHPAPPLITHKSLPSGDVVDGQIIEM